MIKSKESDNKLRVNDESRLKVILAKISDTEIDDRTIGWEPIVLTMRLCRTLSILQTMKSSARSEDQITCNWKWI
jgi:hypothetical protein